MPELTLGQPDPQQPEGGNVLAYFRVVLHDAPDGLAVSSESQAETEGHLIGALVEAAQASEVIKMTLVKAVAELAMWELQTYNG